MRLRNKYGLTGFGFSLVIGGAILLVIAVVMTLTVTLGRHYGRQACHTYAAQTNRETKFVIYTTFGTGDCLAHARDGRWIPTNNLREVAP